MESPKALLVPPSAPQPTGAKTVMVQVTIPTATLTSNLVFAVN
jgi:hypothetical protein